MDWTRPTALAFTHANPTPDGSPPCRVRPDRAPRAERSRADAADDPVDGDHHLGQQGRERTCRHVSRLPGAGLAVPNRSRLRRDDPRPRRGWHPTKVHPEDVARELLRAEERGGLPGSLRAAPRRHDRGLAGGGRPAPLRRHRRQPDERPDAPVRGAGDVLAATRNRGRRSSGGKGNVRPVLGSRRQARSPNVSLNDAPRRDDSLRFRLTDRT